MYYSTYPYGTPYPMPSCYPFLSAFGNQNELIEKVTDALIIGMESENEAIDFYTRLSKMAPNKMAREAVEHALEDEQKHLDLFKDVYEKITGEKPNFKQRKKKFTTFKEGVLLAYEGELRSYSRYRDNYLLTHDPMLRDIFFQAMTDENDHAIRFVFLYHNV